MSTVIEVGEVLVFQLNMNTKYTSLQCDLGLHTIVFFGKGMKVIGERVE